MIYHISPLLTCSNLLDVLLLEPDHVVELGERDGVVLGDVALVEASLPLHLHVARCVTVWKSETSGKRSHKEKAKGMISLYTFICSFINNNEKLSQYVDNF